MYPSHQIVFSCSPPESVYADYDKISHVISNLIGNAVKYSKEGSIVKVTSSANQKGIEIVVTDQGIGIKPQDLRHVFDRYFRADTERGAAGFGIGLYLCYEIIRLHEGKIWVESEVGKGSSFHFTLPGLIESKP